MRAVSHPYRLWLWLTLCLAALGCQKSASPTAPTGTLAPTTPVTVSFGPGESIPAMFEVTIDPSAMSATSRPLIARTATGFQASQFDLDITKFQKQAQFDVQSVQFTEIGDVEVTFRHAHPWNAVDIAQPPSATNRADLGYTGRLLILADLQPADIPSHTFFTDVKANTELIRGADGYVQPGDLLAKSGFNANCFPYMLLADEAKDNRIGVSNGGIVTGNWDPAVGGWQRSNLGPSGDGWTGYDFVHAGQTIENSFVLNADELTGGPVTLQVALLIKYTEPKGVGGEVGRTLRLPPETVDVLQFAYRAPHAALDVSRVAVDDPWAQSNGKRYPDPLKGDPILQIEGALSKTLDMGLKIRDWDRLAAEAVTQGIAGNADVALVEPGTSGTPVVSMSCPALTSGIVSGAVTDLAKTGKPKSEVPVSLTLFNDTGLPTLQDVAGLLRITDAGSGVGTGSPSFGVDPITLAADQARAVKLTTFQLLLLRTIPVKPTWTSHVVDNSGATGRHLSMLVLDQGTPVVTDDRLAISYVDETATSLKLAITTVLVPTSAADWNIQTIDNSGITGYNPEMVLWRGRLAIAYRSATLNAHRMARALVTTPTTPADWQLSTMLDDVNPEDPDSYEAVTLFVEPTDRLMFAGTVHEPWPAQSSDLIFAHSVIDPPTGSSDWVSYPIAMYPDSQARFGAGFAVLDGRLVAAQDNGFTDLMYLEALVDGPLTASDWSSDSIFDCTGAPPQCPTTLNHKVLGLYVFDGRPVISTFELFGIDANLIHARVPHPSRPADWVVGGCGIGGLSSGVPGMLGNSICFSADRAPEDGLYGVRDLVRNLVRFPLRPEDWIYQLDIYEPLSLPGEIAGMANRYVWACQGETGNLTVGYNLQEWK